LTLGCARCHDHKFDPLPTRDYYSLLSIFTSTRTMQGLGTVAKTFERTLSPAESPEVLEQRKTLEKSRKDLRAIEKEFGKTPEQEKAKRTELHNQAELLRAKIRETEAALPPVHSVLSVEEGSSPAYGTQPRNLHVQVRGNYVTAAEEAPPIFLRIVAGESARPFLASQVQPSGPVKPATIRYGATRPASGRKELAEWLTAPDNPLTARVWVNRVWRHHFGRGIVATPDNFGRLGERPTHPELLDWLATRFREDGWSTAKLHRRILLSQTYRQAIGLPSDRDPENRWLASYPRRRLDAETLRDSVLAVAGTLDRTIGGTLFTNAKNFEYVGTVQHDNTRRTIYQPINRSNVYPYLQTFDFPDPCTPCGSRATTTVAPQALFLLNSELMQKQAGQFAQSLKPGAIEDRIRQNYARILQREPSAVEVTIAQEFVTELQAGPHAATAWAALAQALMASNEFLYGE
jgi:hypothetical protein